MLQSMVCMVGSTGGKVGRIGTKWVVSIVGIQ